MDYAWRTSQWLLWWLWLACAGVAAVAVADDSVVYGELEVLSCNGRNCRCESSGTNEFYCNVNAYQFCVEKTGHLLKRSMNRSNFLLLHKTGSAGQPGLVPLIETSDSPREQRLENTVDTNVTVDAKTKLYYSVQCLDKNLSYEQLPRLIGKAQVLDKVEFKQGCGLPGSSLGRILDVLGVAVRKLVLDRVLNASNSTLPPDLLTGLGALSTLSLTHNGLTSLPDGLFEPLTNLTWLDLKRNNIKLDERSLAALPRLRTLELDDNGLNQLPSGVFSGLLELRVLHLGHNALTEFPSDALAANMHLLELDLSANPLHNVPVELLANATHLQELTISGAWFSSLPMGLFTKTRALRRLILWDNAEWIDVPARMLAGLQRLEFVWVRRAALRQLPSDLLAGTNELRKLYVTGTRLEGLPVRLLRDTRNLEILDLSNNLLNVIPPDAFNSLGTLRELYLKDNAIKTITAGLRTVFPFHRNLTACPYFWIRYRVRDAFNGLVAVEKIDLSGNRLLQLADATLERTPRLLRFDVQHNDLVVASWKLSQPLRELCLHHNKLREVPDAWRRNAPTLVTLDLANNNITQLQYSDFLFVRTNNSTIDLRHNTITTLSLSETEYKDDQNNSDSMAAPVHLLLGDNPFTCDCSLYWFLRAIRERGRIRTSFVSLENAICSQPKSMRGRALNTLDLAALRCELPATDCPTECTCAIRMHNLALIVECTNVTHLPMQLKHLGYPIVLRLNYANVSRLRRGDLSSSLVELDMENGTLTDVEEGAFPAGLRLLHLRFNQLAALDTLSAQHLLANGRRVWLAGNPLRCDCVGAPLLAAIQQHYTQFMVTRQNEYAEKYLELSSGDGKVVSIILTRVQLAKVNNHSKNFFVKKPFKYLNWCQVEDYGELRCPGKKFVSLVTTGALCRPDIAVATGSVLAVLGLLIGVAAVLFYKYKREAKVWLYARGLCLRWFIDEELDRDKRYDAFVSFSHLDEQFVISELVPPLEAGPHPLRLCLHFRDWVPGESIPAQIAASVQASRRTIVVLSQNYLGSAWGRVEFNVATAEAERVRAPRLIVVLLGDVGPTDGIDPELRAYLTTNTYIKWGDPWFWDKLKYALLHRHRRRTDSSDADRSVLRRSHFDDRLELDESEKPIANGKDFSQRTAEPAPASA
ncbi:Protein toll [Eumeta japonica]|uniref:Protein toll n=1 Tax=Eumeta variegata TaxID=151549 RepID=A0A4C1Z204_EUMVA|nr:Protein toll [Eumeta japonica]